jgi:hypothetical protein
VAALPPPGLWEDGVVNGILKHLPHTHNNFTNICPIRTGRPCKDVVLKFMVLG